MNVCFEPGNTPITQKDKLAIEQKVQWLFSRKQHWIQCIRIQLNVLDHHYHCSVSVESQHLNTIAIEDTKGEALQAMNTAVQRASDHFDRQWKRKRLL